MILTMLGSALLPSLSIVLLFMAGLVHSAKMVHKEEIMKMKKEAEQHQEIKKEELLEELQEAQILKEWEIIVKNLDDEQLDNIEEILAKNLERSREFEMIMTELKAMGMDEQDISDLKQLAEYMHEFLIQIPNLKIKLEIANNNDLLDNIQVFPLIYLQIFHFLSQLYLLGLPNKLGPLGYIALHHILDGENEGNGEIVDVIVDPESVLEDEIDNYVDKSYDAGLEDIAPTFRTKRSTIEKVP